MKSGLILSLLGLATVSASSCNLECLNQCYQLNYAQVANCQDACNCGPPAPSLPSTQLIKAKYEYDCLTDSLNVCTAYPVGSAARQSCIDKAKKFNQYCQLNYIPDKFQSEAGFLAHTKGCSTQTPTHRECYNLYLAFLGKKHFSLTRDIDTIQRQTLKGLHNQISLNAYLNFTFGDYDIDITFDDVEFSDFVNDYYEYVQNYKQSKRQVKRQFHKDLSTAYKTAIAKIYLDFGENFTPLYEAYFKLVNSSQVTGTNCSDTCFYSHCFRPENFTYSCLNDCGCYMDEAQHDAAIKNLFDEYQNTEQKLGQEAQEVLSKFAPTMKKHQEFVKNVTDEYFALLRNHGEAFFGCDNTCITSCTNTDYYNIYNVEGCLQTCQCTGTGFLDVKEGRHSIPEVALFAKDKPYGSDYFNTYFIF